MPGSRLQTVRNSVMAQDDEYDLVTTTAAGTLASKPGLVVDLASVDTLNLAASWWQQNAVEAFTINGKLKVLIGDITPYTYFSPIIFFIKKQVVDEFKLENPYELVRSGVDALGTNNTPDGLASMYASAESAVKEAIKSTLELLNEE